MRIAAWIPKLLLFGLVGGGTAMVVRRRRMRRRHAGRRLDPDLPDLRGDLGPDPRDPVQALDDLVVFYEGELGVDAQPFAEPEEPLYQARPRDETHDVGDLYGVHTPPAIDRHHPDDQEAFAQGESWLEALEESAVENGPEVERELDFTDDDDVRTGHKTDTKDTPVADRGAGGPGGL
jgi:hypothetical protein